MQLEPLGENPSVTKAERVGYDPVRENGPLRQAIRLLRHQDAGRSPTRYGEKRTATENVDPLMRPCSNRSESAGTGSN